MDYQGLRRSSRFWPEEHRVIDSWCRSWQLGGPEVSGLTRRAGETTQPSENTVGACCRQLHTRADVTIAALVEVERARPKHQQPGAEGLQPCNSPGHRHRQPVRAYSPFTDRPKCPRGCSGWVKWGHSDITTPRALAPEHGANPAHHPWGETWTCISHLEWVRAGLSFRGFSLPFFLQHFWPHRPKAPCGACTICPTCLSQICTCCSVSQLCPTLCDPVGRSMPGLPPLTCVRGLGWQPGESIDPVYPGQAEHYLVTWAHRPQLWQKGNNGLMTLQVSRYNCQLWTCVQEFQKAWVFCFTWRKDMAYLLRWRGWGMTSMRP